MIVSEIIPSIACNLDTAILTAALPLLESGEVGGLEWSFDTLYSLDYQLPEWFHNLLQTYGNANRLVGHGVFFSLFSGKFSDDQAAWLNRLSSLSKTYQFDHVTEHFGFMTGTDFHKGAPLSIPFNKQSLLIGKDRIARIADVVECPVGLENLAFAFEKDDVRHQAEFLEQLLRPVNGFIILDLHNAYCQMHNFNIDAFDILKYYPLEMVREIHISGGSWAPHPLANQQKVRRDTHDDAVPQIIFDLLKAILPLCPNLKFVVMEQLGVALTTTAQQLQYQNDYTTMQQIVKKFNQEQIWPKQISDFRPSDLKINSIPVESKLLYQQQQCISEILSTSNNYEEAKFLLNNSILVNSDWQIEKWNPEMLDTAFQIAKKWK